MSLSRRLRDWFHLASTGALAMYHRELDARTGMLTAAISASDARLEGAQRLWQDQQEAWRGEVAQLRDDAAGLRGELATVHGLVQTLQAELQSGRDATEDLRNDLAALCARFDLHAEQADAGAQDLSALRTHVEGGGVQTEALRLKLVALGEQVRWEADDLRKALTAVAERVERIRRVD